MTDTTRVMEDGSDLVAASFGLSPLASCLPDRTPAAIRPIDLESCGSTLPLAKSRSGLAYRALLALVREHGRPLGWVSLPVCEDEADLSALPAPEACPGPTSSEPCTRSLMTVAIATCANVEATRSCVQQILDAGDDRIEIIVVENRPAASTVRSMLERTFPWAPIRYVEEVRPGLGAARNAALRASRGSLIGFTDDDVKIDERWIATLRAAFTDPSIDCVTGLIAPSELETPAQLLLERFASYSKGFERRVYSLAEAPTDEPLFPYAAGHFASGANIAFRASALLEIGGFDPFLGTGTPARGCEDLDVCIRLLKAGGTLAYEPAAIVWHRHPDTTAGVRRRAFDYGAALGAMLTKHVLTGSARDILAKGPAGARYFLASDSRKNVARDPSFPAIFGALELAGLLYGPAAYALSRLRGPR